MPSTICLNLLVKEPSEHVFDSLASIQKHIDYWVIADLGCRQETIDAISEQLAEIPGEFVHVDNDTDGNIKTALIEYSKQFTDYLLLADLNMHFNVKDDEFKEGLTKDAYFLGADMPVQRHEIRLIRSSLNWGYHGDACETLLCKDPQTTELLEPVTFSIRRSKEQAEQELADKISVLTRSLDAQADDSHALFHYAKLNMQQSELHTALDAFDHYLEIEEAWDPEWQWYALYHRGKLLEKLQQDRSIVIDAYLAAYQNRPQRAEPLYELARLYRTSQQFEFAHLYSTLAFETPLAATEHYDLESAVYYWHAPSEHALSCQHLNKPANSIKAANQALRSVGNSLIPKNMRESLIYSRQLAIDTIQQTRENPTQETQNDLNRIELVVPFRNAGPYLKKSIKTLLQQDYENFGATFIDDCSDDGCSELVPVDDDRFTLIQNTERVGPLVNRMNFINSCEPKDIIVYLDGDDQLASSDCLSYINQVYQRQNCWLTYGQYLSQNGTFGYAQPYADQQQLTEELESGEMRFPMHPITHRAGLFHRITEYDPELTSFKDDYGNWLFYASDAVLARPLFYLAGAEHIHYCNRVLYLYTEGHEISESIDNKKDQMDTCRIINTRVRPPRIEHYLPSRH